MLEWVHLAERSYPRSIELMHQKVQEMIAGSSKMCVMLLEYDDVYTLGSSANSSDLLDIGKIPFYKTDRGGQATYHGPGQRIIYPIIDLAVFDKDIKKYLHFLANAVIATLAEFGVESFFCPERVGIWVRSDDRDLKIASIGIKVKKWVAYHGIAVNIAPDLANFGRIIACGLAGCGQTSLQALGMNASLADFDQVLQKHFMFRA